MKKLVIAVALAATVLASGQVPDRFDPETGGHKPSGVPDTISVGVPPSLPAPPAVEVEDPHPTHHSISSGPAGQRGPQGPRGPAGRTTVVHRPLTPDYVDEMGAALEKRDWIHRGHGRLINAIVTKYGVKSGSYATARDEKMRQDILTKLGRQSNAGSPASTPPQSGATAPGGGERMQNFYDNVFGGYFGAILLVVILTILIALGILLWIRTIALNKKLDKEMAGAVPNQNGHQTLGLPYGAAGMFDPNRQVASGLDIDKAVEKGFRIVDSVTPFGAYRKVEPGGAEPAGTAPAGGVTIAPVFNNIPPAPAPNQAPGV